MYTIGVRWRRHNRLTPSESSRIVSSVIRDSSPDVSASSRHRPTPRASTITVTIAFRDAARCPIEDRRCCVRSGTPGPDDSSYSEGVNTLRVPRSERSQMKKLTIRRRIIASFAVVLALIVFMAALPTLVSWTSNGRPPSSERCRSRADLHQPDRRRSDRELLADAGVRAADRYRREAETAGGHPGQARPPGRAPRSRTRPPSPVLPRRTCSTSTRAPRSSTGGRRTAS